MLLADVGKYRKFSTKSYDPPYLEVRNPPPGFVPKFGYAVKFELSDDNEY